MKPTLRRNTATALLKTQHRKTLAILKKLESGRSEAQPLLFELASDLAAHMQIEQDIFYPAVREIDEDIVLESFEEHAVAEIALKRLLATSSDEPTFKAKVILLKELINHHVKEEENELFPKVDKRMPAEENRALARQMKETFERVKSQGHEATLPKGGRTSADLAERRVLRDLAAAAAE